MLTGLQKLELPGLKLMEANADYSGNQTIFIDFDGAEGVSYDNDALNIHIDGLSIADSGLSQSEQTQILSDLNNTFAGTGLTFTATAPVNEEYSTIYVGGDDAAFSGYGSFNGLSETVDAGNLVKNDEAFVFSDKINSIVGITETIAHEAGHLLGFAHEGDAVLDSIGDFAEITTLPDGSTKLTASDGERNDNLGFSVSVSDGNIAAGAHQDDDKASNSGAAYLYRWTGTSYDEVKLTASNGSGGDYLAYCVAVSKNNIVAGAHQDDDMGNDSGSAYVYRWGGTDYTEYQLTASDGYDYDNFGRSVAISGENVLVGASENDDAGNSSGAAYLYSWNGTGYEERLKLTASDAEAYDYFGYSVAISAENIVIGAYGDNNKNNGYETGGAYVYHSNKKAYSEILLSASDGAEGDNFGYSADIDGYNVVVGAFGDDDNGDDAGSAYVYRWNGTSYDEVKLTASDGAEGDYFGYSVAIDGDNIVVGAYGDDGTGDLTGCAYLYHWNGSSYDEYKIIAGDEGSYDRFGHSVAIDGDTIGVGAYADTDNGSNSGSVYVFDAGTFLEKSTASNDFDGNYQSDVVRYLSDTGHIEVYLNGSESVEQKIVGGADTATWDYVGTGDLNADGATDILWRNKNSGDVGAWILDKGTGDYSSWTDIGGAATGEWEISGIGDFNGDGTDDVLWNNTESGIMGAWLINDGAYSAWSGISGEEFSGWDFAGIGDFNGDGADDILWGNEELGKLGTWLMDGGAYSSSEIVAGADPATWDLSGIGDFNGDGTEDILWRNKTSGDVGAWLLDGGVYSSWTDIAGADVDNWAIEGVGDYNGDGTDDVLWCNSETGLLGYWQIENGQYSSWAVIA